MWGAAALWASLSSEVGLVHAAPHPRGDAARTHVGVTRLPIDLALHVPICGPTRIAQPVTGVSHLPRAVA
jgi:hypothetical protein